MSEHSLSHKSRMEAKPTAFKGAIVVMWQDESLSGTQVIKAPKALPEDSQKMWLVITYLEEEARELIWGKFEPKMSPVQSTVGHLNRSD